MSRAQWKVKKSNQPDKAAEPAPSTKTHQDESTKREEAASIISGKTDESTAPSSYSRGVDYSLPSVYGRWKDASGVLYDLQIGKSGKVEVLTARQGGRKTLASAGVVCYDQYVPDWIVWDSHGEAKVKKCWLLGVTHESLLWERSDSKMLRWERMEQTTVASDSKKVEAAAEDVTPVSAAEDVTPVSAAGNAAPVSPPKAKEDEVMALPVLAEPPLQKSGSVSSLQVETCTVAGDLIEDIDSLLVEAHDGTTDSRSAAQHTPVKVVKTSVAAPGAGLAGVSDQKDADVKVAQLRPVQAVIASSGTSATAVAPTVPQAVSPAVITPAVVASAAVAPTTAPAIVAAAATAPVVKSISATSGPAAVPGVTQSIKPTGVITASAASQPGVVSASGTNAAPAGAVVSATPGSGVLRTVEGAACVAGAAYPAVIPSAPPSARIVGGTAATASRPSVVVAAASPAPVTPCGSGLITASGAPVGARPSVVYQPGSGSFMAPNVVRGSTYAVGASPPVVKSGATAGMISVPSQSGGQYRIVSSPGVGTPSNTPSLRPTVLAPGVSAVAPGVTAVREGVMGSPAPKVVTVPRTSICNPNTSSYPGLQVAAPGVAVANQCMPGAPVPVMQVSAARVNGFNPATSSSVLPVKQTVPQA